MQFEKIPHKPDFPNTSLQSPRHAWNMKPPLLSQTCGKSSKNTLLPTYHNHKHIYTPPPIKKNDETLIFEAALILHNKLPKNQKKNIFKTSKNQHNKCVSKWCVSVCSYL